MTNNITSSARPAPPIGGFEEVEGRRIFVHRSGSGGPAVVFLPGASAIGLDYLGVQREVARFTTAVVYDRGGTGYSDPLGLPRAAASVASELRELLRAQGIPAPYVLVPHSLGGAYAHRFAQLYPSEVAGLVWLDAFHRDWDDFVPPELGLAASERMAPTLEQLRQGLPAIRAMCVELLADFPAHVRGPLIEYHVSDTWIQVGMAERGKLAALADELRPGPNVPDVPVVALTALGVDAGQRALMSERSLHQMHDGKTKMAEALVSAVSHGEHRILTDTDHSRLCFDRPDAVVQAIRDVLDRA